MESLTVEKQKEQGRAAAHSYTRAGGGIRASEKHSLTKGNPRTSQQGALQKQVTEGHRNRQIAQLQETLNQPVYSVWNSDSAAPVQRSPESWKSSDQLGGLLNIPHGWGFSTWKKLKEEIREYRNLPDTSTRDKREEKLNKIATLTEEWIKKHRNTDESDRVRTIYFFIKILFQHIHDEMVELGLLEPEQQREPLERSEIASQSRQPEIAGQSEESNQGGATLYKKGNETICIRKGGDTFKATYSDGEGTVTTNSYLSFSTSNNTVELIYLQADPKRKGIGTLLIAHAADYFLRVGLKNATIAETSPDSIHLAMLLIRSNVHPAKREKKKKSATGNDFLKGGNERIDIEILANLTFTIPENIRRALEVSKSLPTDILQERYFDLASIKKVYKNKASEWQLNK